MLTSKFVDLLRLIIVLDRLEALGFVFFEDVNARFRGDFSIAMTEVLGNDREEVKFLPLAKVKLCVAQ